MGKVVIKISQGSVVTQTVLGPPRCRNLPYKVNVPKYVGWQ